MSKEKDLLNELIATRNELTRVLGDNDELIDKFDEIINTVREQEEYDEDWDDGKYWYEDEHVKIKYPPKKCNIYNSTYNYSPTITIDCSTHNHTHRESHVSSNVALGDKACRTIGGILGGLFS